MPSFTRQHYTKIAATLARMADKRDLFNRAELSELVENLCDLFAKDNPNFKPAVFRKAVWKDGQ